MTIDTTPNQQQQEQTIRPEVSSRVHTGSLSWNAAGNGVSSSGVVRTSSNDLQAGATDILGTARGAGDFPTSRLTPETTVLLDPSDPTSRTSLAVAEKLGYVRRNALGGYEAIPQGDSAQQPQAQNQDDGVELFEPAQEQAYGAAIADIPQTVYDSAMIKVANHLGSTGELLDITASLNASTGLPAEKLQAIQDMAQKLYQPQADKAIKSLGVEPQDLYTWARENKPEVLQRAVRDHLSARSLSGYRDLARSYLDKVGPSSEALQAHGLETKKGADGEELVKIQGSWMSVKVAARVGLI